MKKKFLFIPLVSTCLIAYPICKVCAEETEPIVEQVDEVATIGEQLNDFATKWFIPIASFVSGCLGITSSILLFLKKINKKIDNHEKLTKDDYEEAKTLCLTSKEQFEEKVVLLEQTNESLNLSMEQFKQEFDAIKEVYSKTLEEQGKKYNNLMLELATFKALICNMVATNKELIENGFAKQIIELCDMCTEETTETITENVEGADVNE